MYVVCTIIEGQKGKVVELSRDASSLTWIRLVTPFHWKAEVSRLTQVRLLTCSFSTDRIKCVVEFELDY